tara:strand:+ start:242 stop:343 length:102 start_codon:yes stop_codon:yes gene_type:complete
MSKGIPAIAIIAVITKKLNAKRYEEIFSILFPL